MPGTCLAKRIIPEIFKTLGMATAFVAAAAMFVLADAIMMKATAADCATDRDECVLEAISGLDPTSETAWTKGGKPRVDALKMATGLADLNAKERDSAWTAFPAWKERHEQVAALEEAVEAARSRATMLETKLGLANNEKSRYMTASIRADRENERLRAENLDLREESRLVEAKYRALERGDKPCAEELGAVKAELNSTWFSRKPVVAYVQCMDAGGG